MIETIVVIVSVIAGLWAWVVIHEFSHVLMAKYLLDGVEWKIRWMPRYIGKGMAELASVQYWYDADTPQTPRKRGAICMAPLIPSLAAVAIFPFASAQDTLWFSFWFWGLINILTFALGGMRFHQHMQLM